MKNLSSIFDEFLKDQKKRLKPRSFKKYKSVIELFQDYLDGYAYNYLSEEDYEKFWEKYQTGVSFCELFSLEKIGVTQFEEFMGTFIIRKVGASKTLMKNTGIVMRKLVNWLQENSYLDSSRYESIQNQVNKLKKDLPLVYELSELLFDEGVKNSIYQYEEFQEGNYIIAEIEPDQFWLKKLNKVKEEIGPVVVSEEISELAEENWLVYLKLGKIMNKWFIIESGNVYPA